MNGNREVHLVGVLFIHLGNDDVRGHHFSGCRSKLTSKRLKMPLKKI